MAKEGAEGARRSAWGGRASSARGLAARTHQDLYNLIDQRVVALRDRLLADEVQQREQQAVAAVREEGVALLAALDGAEADGGDERLELVHRTGRRRPAVSPERLLELEQQHAHAAVGLRAAAARRRPVEALAEAARQGEQAARSLAGELRLANDGEH